MEFRFVNNKKEKITKDCLKTALLIYFFTISLQPTTVDVVDEILLMYNFLKHEWYEEDDYHGSRTFWWQYCC